MESLSEALIAGLLVHQETLSLDTENLAYKIIAFNTPKWSIFLPQTVALFTFYLNRKLMQSHYNRLQLEAFEKHPILRLEQAYSL